MRRLIPAAALGLAVLGCRRDDAPASTSEYGGTLVISTGADVKSLMPPTIESIQENSVVDIVFERLAEPGPDLNSVGDRGFIPELASSWEWGADSLSIAFTLQPNAHFHDGVPVTAADVAFSFDVYTDPLTNTGEAELLAQIDSVTVRDPSTVVFWFARRYPQQFIDAAYQMRILPKHLLENVPRRELRTAPFGQAPIGSGQFKFVRRDPGALIELHADTTHARGRPFLDRIVWTVTPDHEAAMTRLLAGDADFIEQVTANKIAEIGRHPDLALARYPSLDIAYLQFNLRDPRSPNAPHPIFGNREVRRALAMAIDRPRLIAAVLDSLGSPPYGPVTMALATADSTIPQIPYDTARAAQLLDSLGWQDRDRDGVRERGGRPLRFSIVSPSTSQNRIRMAVLVQDMLKRIGVRVDLQQMDIGPFLDLASSRTFDVVFGAAHYDPSPAGIRQTWTSAGALSKASNFGSYMNPAFDAVVDSATMAMDPDIATRQYHRAYEIIVADAPAVWLYEPVNYAAYNKRVQLKNLRADAWWASIGEWQIPPKGRLPRDGGGEGRTAN